MTELGHLGDGVYLSHDNYQLWLAANSHENKLIALEPQVFFQMIKKAGDLWDKQGLALVLRAIADDFDPPTEKEKT